MKSVTSSQALAVTIRNDNARRKRLGQYYTGERLARLLSALADGQRASSVLDPMAGTGDMLIACAGSAKALGAIEVDPIAHAACLHRLNGRKSSSAVLLGNAFSVETLRRLPMLEWDLVMTNPPYVRYQETVSRAAVDDLHLPSAAEVRQGLLEAIEILPALDPSDKQLFRQLAESYSGLADLAVPSWILCAGLVRPGGTLAMVVPNAWLSRDYANPIHYLLARWFDVDVVVEDADAAWFNDALVRTTLLVAHRIPRRDADVLPPASVGYLHLKVSQSAADERSVVGAAYPSDEDPDQAFAKDSRRWRDRREVTDKRMTVTGRWVPATHGAQVAQQWLDSRTVTQGGVATNGQRPPLPPALAAIVDSNTQYATLDELGWQVGQGLRTGANQFFYVERVGQGAVGTDAVTTSKVLGGETLPVPSDALAPVLRRQAELPVGHVLQASALRGRLLLLSHYALAEDMAPLSESPYRALSDVLAAYIRSVALLNLGTADEPRFVPALSAVAPNVRPSRLDAPPRFWYQLPSLTTRHRPDLVVARINYGHPTTFINPEREVIVDANFSTLWRTQEGGPNEHALLAALNSSWCAAALELSSTVLGGGALKVEAAHIRRLPLPARDTSAWHHLERLGHRLSKDEGRDNARLTREIDAAVLSAFCSPKRVEAQLARVKQVAAEQLSARSRP